MTGKVAAAEFKARCLSLMDRVAERHETYVITKRGKPVAKLVPVAPDSEGSIFGCLRERGRIEGDIISPVLPAGDGGTVTKWDRLVGQGRLSRAPKKKRRTRSRAS